MATVDIHTHMYPPTLARILRSRSSVPYIKPSPDQNVPGDRLIILPSEESSTGTSLGRPIGPEYYDIREKISFMDLHSIDVSVLSLANPWLDWVPAPQAAETAQVVNDDVEGMCAAYPGRLFHFGTLPVSASSVDGVVAEVTRLRGLKYCRGIVMGTSGLGQGLDDARLDPIWKAVEESGMLVFVHPHYGLPGEVYGPRAGEYGHVLALAMGFPVETTIAVTRMLLAGVFDRFPRLNVLLAHSGGTLPFLAGRIESCIAHDAHMKKTGTLEKRRDVWDVLKKNIYLDAVIYSEVGLKAAIDASGADRLMLGTDHPFFPPLAGEEKEWLSVTLNNQAVRKAMGEDTQGAKDIMGGNAVRILRLDGEHRHESGFHSI